jgi:hypothetical protein
MAERTVLVCDVCGEVAESTVQIRVNDRTLLKDLCSKHVAELVRGTRKPKRGRPRGASARATSPTRKRATSRKKASGTTRSASGRRRARKARTSAPEPAESAASA